MINNAIIMYSRSAGTKKIEYVTDINFEVYCNHYLYMVHCGRHRAAYHFNEFGFNHIALAIL